MSTPALRFDNSYSRLPEAFYSRVEPVRVPEPRLIRVNEALAEHLNRLPERRPARPRRGYPPGSVT